MENMEYLEVPTIPPGMTCDEYRAAVAGCNLTARRLPIHVWKWFRWQAFRHASARSDELTDASAPSRNIGANVGIYEGAGGRGRRVRNRAARGV